MSPVAWQHVNLIGSFEFGDEDPIVDMQALAAHCPQKRIGNSRLPILRCLIFLVCLITVNQSFHPLQFRNLRKICSNNSKLLAANGPASKPKIATDVQQQQSNLFTPKVRQRQYPEFVRNFISQKVIFKNQ